MSTKRGPAESSSSSRKAVFFSRHKQWMAATTLIGTIIGAGILALPYVLAKAGFLYGLIALIIFGIIFLYLNLFIGEIVLRTKKQYQLTGYAEKYLGVWGKRLMTFSFIFGIYGALIAYTIGEGQALHAIFKMGSPLLWSLIFFAVALFIVHKGVATTGKIELVLVTLLIGVIFLIGVLSFDRIQLGHLSTRNLLYFFFPYGALLFAYSGGASVPEMQEVLGKDKKLLKKAIIWGTLIPIIVYVLFSAVVLGIVGLEHFEALQPNERIATVALSFYASPFLGTLANIVAVLTMSTSFLTLSLALLGMYTYDYAFSRWKASLLTFLIPFLIAFFNLTDFIRVIDTSGTVAVGLVGILIVLMYWKAKQQGERTPEYALPKYSFFGVLLIVMFSLGILYELWQIFKFLLI
ncbi:amino acid permease [Candidatus Woesearchaeota archaeon]|nr:amino acid permease [Candidatus Woesearchaeota archaeon]